MTPLFESGDLRKFLHDLLSDAGAAIERIPEDELLSRSVDDLVEQFLGSVVLQPLKIGTEPMDGDVSETTVDVSHDWAWHGDRARGTRVRATYDFQGDARLLKYQPSQHIMTRFEAALGQSTVTVEAVRPGIEVAPDQFNTDLQRQIETIARQAGYANNDVGIHNRNARKQIESMIVARQERVRKRRDLAGALGFPMHKRADAPRPVPMQRKRVAPSRRPRGGSEPYRDEPALTTSQYEDAIAVVRSTLLAMERTPSVASGKTEEELRDQMLVQLNGTFEGAATGETFVQRGKTDILISVEDRHVFVAECKWWSGPKACSTAIDQLLGYLPWRNEKAALILFIDRRDATAVIEKADEVMRAHDAFKRVGASSDQPMARRNFVLGHPDDMDREIQLAALFAVLPKGGDED
jgi:hypothetical protein